MQRTFRPPSRSTPRRVRGRDDERRREAALRLLAGSASGDGRRHRLPGAALAAAVVVLLGIAGTARAERLLVVAETEWSTRAREAKPGDVITLLPGVHRPATLEGLHGTKEAPIVVTSSASDRLAEIATTDVALRLVDCSHVRVDRVLVRDAPGSAIALEAGAAGGCREIEIRSLLVINRAPRTEPATGRPIPAPQRGMTIRGADGVRVLASRIDGAADAGIFIEDSKRIALEDLQVVGPATLVMRAGIEVGAGGEEVRVARTTVAGRVGSGLVVGPTQGDATATAPRGIQIVDASVLGTERAITFGRCDGVVIERLSVVDPTVEILQIAPAEGGATRGVRLSWCAFLWSPGRIRRLVGGAPPADPSGIELADNLWFSRELPLALPALGPAGNPFVVRVTTPQRTDLDPRADDLGRSENPEAARFGRSRNEPPASKGP